MGKCWCAARLAIIFSIAMIVCLNVSQRDKTLKPQGPCTDITLTFVAKVQWSRSQKYSQEISYKLL
jgi:hypothetical protein